jgi:hypothetical protein
MTPPPNEDQPQNGKIMSITHHISIDEINVTHLVVSNIFEAGIPINPH